MAGVSTLWQPYGLSGNPFFQAELRVGEGGHPISLFVGREEELRRAGRRMASDDATRTIVEGAAGVGKTSFVNRLKVQMAAAGAATYDRPIRIESGTTRASFVADVLRTLLRIRLGLGLSNASGVWAKSVRLLEGEDLVGANVSIMGVGGGVSRGYVAPQLPADSLFEHLGSALEQMTAELEAPVVLHVNNLESLALDDVQRAARLLLDLRDYLLIPGAHWIFVGTSGIEDAVFRAHDQVSGIFPQALVLDPLPPAVVEALIALRYGHLALPRAAVTAPVEPAVAARLYSLYQGDLRNFLRLLSEASEVLLGVHGVRPMEEDEIRRFGAVEYERKVRARLGEDDFQHLGRIVEHARGGEVRVTDAMKATKLKQSSASLLFQRLEEKRAIRPTRTEGRSRYYRPLGDVLVAFGVAPEA